MRLKNYLGMLRSCVLRVFDLQVPAEWGESDARLINNPQIVKLRSVDTKVIAYPLNYVV